jgi:tetratricopeptide (TPR) repeat protein
LQYKYKANGYLEAGQVSLAIEAYQKALDDAIGDERQTGVLLYLRSAAYLQRAGAHRNKLKTIVQDLTSIVPSPNRLVNVLNVAYYRPTLSNSVFRRILYDTEQQDRQFRSTQYWHGLYQYALLQASQDALRATEVLPHYADAWIRAGDILGELWKLNEAISYYEQAIQLNESLGDTILPLVTRLERRQELLAEARSYRWSEDTLRLALDVAG